MFRQGNCSAHSTISLPKKSDYRLAVRNERDFHGHVVPIDKETLIRSSISICVPNAVRNDHIQSRREGQSRTVYGLRHIYIRLPLMVGADFYRIATNCRTSVEMIEKFYASHIRTLLDAAAINIARRKTAVSEGAKEPRNAA